MRLPSFEVTVCTGPSSPSAVRAWSSLSIPLHLAQRVIRRRPPAPTSGRRCCRVVGNTRVQVQLGAAGDRAEPEDGDRGVGVLVGAGGRDYEPLRPGHVAKGDGRGAELSRARSRSRSSQLSKTRSGGASIQRTIVNRLRGVVIVPFSWSCRT